MTHYLKKIPDSVFGLKNVRTLAAVAMLLALRIVLGMFANATLACFGNTVKLSAAFIPIAVTGALFGPVPSALVGALGDVLSFIIAPTGGAYFPGFTISGLLTGLIYGIALYGERLSLPRIAAAWAVNTLVAETFLAAFWLYTLYANEPSYSFYLTARLISQAIKCVPEILILFALGKPLEMISEKVFRQKAK
ncbi:MAG: folate family ECF transporter S component [Ruminococcus sp.]